MARLSCVARLRRWRSIAVLLACGIGSWAGPDIAHGARRLVSDEEARHLGLQRAWYAQVRLDRSRNHVERAVLRGDRLTILTSAGLVQELNALTGETMWLAPVGNPNHPSLGPAASDDHVALLNGSTLFVLDRADGRPVMVRPVGGAPGAAPALARKYVFVPLVNGRIEAYPLGEQKLTPWYYQSIGRAMVAPLATPESFVWATDAGYLYVGDSDQLSMRFRLETHSEIVAPPGYRAPYVYVATVSGQVFAVHEMAAALRWKYSTGFTVSRSPAAIEERVFVTSDQPVLHCIDAKTGLGLWEAPNVTQFAATTSRRVYGVDDLGGLVALDAASGDQLARVHADMTTNALVNDQTDRVYLISGDGLVQCLHEPTSKQPIYYQPKVEPQPPSETSGGQPAATIPAVPAEQPTDEQPAPTDDQAPQNTQPPTEESDFGVDENPFGEFE